MQLMVMGRVNMRLGEVSDQSDVRRFFLLAYLRKKSGFRRVTSRTLMTGAIFLANIVLVLSSGRITKLTTWTRATVSFKLVVVGA